MPRLVRFRLVSTACLILTMLSAHTAGQDARPDSHVRADDARLAKAIRDGLVQSRTFRELVARLDQASGLVFLVSSRCVTRVSQPRACLDHNIRVTGGLRFLRVNVHPSESGATLLAVIAHELQHALEILSDETITSLEAVEKLYERIGRKVRSGTVETEAAQAVQDAVYREARAWSRGR
jgi:hypothetical protein